MKRHPSTKTAAQPSHAQRLEEPQSEVRRLAGSELATVRLVRRASSFLARVPVVVIGAKQLQCAELDHRYGFLLSLLDGATTVEQLLDLSGMPAEETLALLEDLRLRGIVAV